MSDAPSWAAVYSLIKKQKAKYAKGTTSENTNEYTKWYGDNGEPFCFMFISWILAHAGSPEKAGLDLIGGKKAYVPYIKNIKGYHSGHSGVKVGAIAAVNKFNHIGFVTKVNSNGTFELYSGNTTYDGSDDAVWPKTYSLSYISGYVNLAYASSSQKDDNDMPIRTSFSINKDQPLKWGEFVTLDWDVENSDPKNTHTKANPGYVAPESSWADFSAALHISGMTDGDEYQLRYEVHNWKDGKSSGAPWTEIQADAKATFGDQFTSAQCSKGLTKGQHCYLSVAVFPKGDVKDRPAPKVVSGRWTIRQDQG